MKKSFLKKRLFVITLAITILLPSIFFTGKAFVDLSNRVNYELKGPLTWDSPIYLALGRGITNGFKPYIDLFETKPPGIFLISALSFYLFDDTMLTYIFQALVVIGISFVPAVLIFLSVKKRERIPINFLLFLT